MDTPFYFLNINKERGITSFDVIFKLRKLLKIKKIGHAGTLDPMAQGVMQVAVGNASRLLEYLNSDKEYVAEIKFGYSSTTLDCEGEITESAPPNFSEEELKEVIKTFIGKIKQTPPKFSAIKVNGKKLCDLARKNPETEIKIPEREIQIYNIELLEFKKDYAKIKINCSKGTYIRTLAQDIAKKLNTDAYLLNLTRTKAGIFELNNSVKIENLDITKDKIEPKDALCLEEYILSEKEYNLVKNGVSIVGNPKTSPVMLIYNEKLVSIGILSDNKIKIKKFFN